MTREEILQAITDIGTLEDPAEIRSRLTTIHDEVSSVYDTNETLRQDNSKFEEDNKKLQRYNMELFLRVGGQQKKTDTPPTETTELKYENLFNEKGDLI